jgi:4-amino-4-deoxy-L-arabinose transferase-like glycosyltransferase
MAGPRFRTAQLLESVRRGTYPRPDDEPSMSTENLPMQEPAAQPARRTRRGTFTVLLVALLVAFAFQGTRSLWDPDEGRYTDVAHNMVDSGDWLVPRLDPERPHFTKPPLTYWAIGASIAAIGDHAWSARLPNALAFVATALLVLGLARRLGLPQPELAALAWTTSLGPVIAANVVTTDTLLASFETLAVYGFVRSGLLHGAARPQRAGLWLMWLGFGLAFLTKGPPGLLPLLAIVAALARDGRGALLRLLDPLGILLFLAVGLGWFVLLIGHSPDLLHYFVVEETVNRVATSEHRRNAGWLGWLAVYGPTLLLGTLPWLAVALAGAWQRRRSGTAAAAVGTTSRRFLALWFLLPLAVFVLSQSRLPLYVLPLFVPLVLWLSTQWAADVAPGRRHLLVAGAAALALAVKLGGAFLHPDEDARRLARDLSQTVDMASVDEVVFVDVPARYGLRHYLGKPVEQVESYPGAIGPEGYAPPDLLCDELDTGERLLLVAPARRLAGLEGQVAGCRHLIRPVGTLRKWALFCNVPDAAGAGQREPPPASRRRSPSRTLASASGSPPSRLRRSSSQAHQTASNSQRAPARSSRSQAPPPSW